MLFRDWPAGDYLIFGGDLVATAPHNLKYNINNLNAVIFKLCFENLVCRSLCKPKLTTRGCLPVGYRACSFHPLITCQVSETFLFYW